MTTTWRPRDSRGHYLNSEDVHTTLGPEDWDDTCRHEQPRVQRCEQCGRRGTHGFTTLTTGPGAPSPQALAVARLINATA